MEKVHENVFSAYFTLHYIIMVRVKLPISLIIQNCAHFLNYAELCPFSPIKTFQ